MRSSHSKVHRLSVRMRRALPALLALVAAACCAVVPFFAARASNPAAGDLAPTAAAPMTWTGTASGNPPAAAGDPLSAEAKCVEGTNCDSFLLTLSGTPVDWAGKRARVKITWLSPTTDYDMVVRRNSITGPVLLTSGRGATSPAGTSLTEEEVVLDPAQVGTGVFAVRAVYYAASGTVDQYNGSAAVETIPAGSPTPQATYLKGGITFSPNVTVKAPYIGQDVEPSTRVDQYGNAYVAAIRGLTSGNDLWYFDLRPTITVNNLTGEQAPNPMYDPFMRNPKYRGQPDAFNEQTGDDPGIGADGGGDVDLAVSRRSSPFENPTDPPELAFTSLLLGNISTFKSEDRGVTFQKNPAGNVTGGVPVDDRQWYESHGANDVYMLYRTANPAVTQIQKSTDHGLTFGLARTAGQIGQVGSIDVHQATGTVYVSGTTGRVCVGERDPILGEPTIYNCNQAVPGIRNIFIPVKVADDGTPNGTAYATYSSGQSIFLAYSKDKGATWSTPVRVSDGPETKSSLFPWLETGPTPGSVALVWYGSSSATNNNNADWRLFYAISYNADTQTPTFRQAEATDHVIHASNISTSGLDPTNPNVNRNLADYFQVAFDPTGAAVIAYCDDHNDFSAHTYVTRQISGPGVNGAVVPAPVEGAGLPSQSTPQPGTPQVTDDALDARTRVLVPRIAEPFDILSIRYSAEDSASGPVLVAKMKVSELTAVPPPGGVWRMNFAANAPDSVLSPTGQYTFGVSDRGDQFWVAARTDGGAAPTYRFGTAVRNGDGSLGYTDRGAADGGSFDSATKTITVKLTLNKLNPFVRAGNLPVGGGSVLVGLRGSAFTTGASDPRSDTARGGTQFTVPNFPCLTNFALSALGSIASASSTYGNGGFPAFSANDGEHKGLNWGNNGGWNDNTRNVWPDSLDITLNTTQNISEIRVYTLQNQFKTPVEPTASTPADLYGIRDFEVQSCVGEVCTTVPGGTITNNDKAMRVITLATPIVTSKLRVVVNAGRSNWSRILEVEAIGCPE